MAFWVASMSSLRPAAEFPDVEGRATEIHFRACFSLRILVIGLIQFMFTPDSLHGLVFGTNLLTFYHNKKYKEHVRPSNYNDIEYKISANTTFINTEKKIRYSVEPRRRRFYTRYKSIIVLREEERCYPIYYKYYTNNLTIPYIRGSTISSTYYLTTCTPEPLLH